jgi:hypothetical protein
MPQLFAEVTLANTFNTWRVRTNDLVTQLNRLANTTGMSNVRSANGTFTNIMTLSGPVTVSGNLTISATKTNITSTNTNITSSNTKISSAVTFTSTGAIKIPVGTTAQRSTHNSPGHLRYSSTLGAFEGYTSAGWTSLASNASLTGTYVANTTFQSALANTNSYISTKAALELTHLANTNTQIATKLTTTVHSSALANTNTAIATKSALASNNNFTSTNQMRLGAPVKTTTANAYTLATVDAGYYHRMAYANSSANPSTLTVTIPANASVAIPIGSEYLFIRTGSNTAMNFANAAGVTLNSDGAKTKVSKQWQTAVCKKVGTNEWDLMGTLSS